MHFTLIREHQRVVVAAGHVYNEVFCEELYFARLRLVVDTLWSLLGRVAELAVLVLAPGKHRARIGHSQAVLLTARDATHLRALQLGHLNLYVKEVVVALGLVTWLVHNLGRDVERLL